jgi:hypothetical protein
MRDDAAHSLRILTTVFVSAIIAGCTTSPARPHTQAAIHAIDGSDVFPSATLTDWVTYSEQIAVVRVTSERRLPDDPGAEPGGSDYVGRSVHLIVERNLWLADGYTPRTALDLVVAGWEIQDGTEIKAASAHSPRIEVGDVLVVPLSQDLDGRVTLLSPHAIVSLAGDPVDIDERTDLAVEALKGRSYDQMSALLAATRVDPTAGPFMGLPPYERLMKVGQAHATPIASPTR